MAIDSESAHETDTMCGNVKGPFCFAQLDDAMTASIGQGSPAAVAAPQSTLCSVKRSNTFSVQSESVEKLNN